MVGSQLPEPVLSIALDAVEKIQGGEETIGALWSVFSRVKDAVENGRRLENMSWRLWHCARVAPRRQFHRSFSDGLPRYPEMLRRPLSSPSLSFSSSSDGTATSSDWDRDTAVGEDDEVQQGLHTSGARRNTVVSPRLEKPRLDLSSGTRLTETLTSHLPSPAPSSHRSHQLDFSQNDVDPARDTPSAPSDSTPHHPPQALRDAGIDVSYERDQGTLVSGSLHHGANLAPPSSGGVEGTSSLHESTSPRICLAQDRTTSATCTGRSTPSSSNHPRYVTEILASTATSSSMPIILPSVAGTRKDTISVGRIIADLFPQKLGGTGRNMGLEGKVQNQSALSNSDGQGRTAEQAVITPQIVEPQPSTPAAGRITSSWFGITPSSSASATTSATATPRQAFPTVVVVNPTPHPTPPATPSPGVSEAPGPYGHGLKPTATPFDRPDRSPEGWATVNGQLATPVSFNGDARPLSPTEPKFVMVDPKPKDLQPQLLNADVTVLPLQTSLLPAAAITLPERPSDSSASHLPTPSSNPHSEMANSSKPTPAAPIPALEDKKFFLAAPHSSSGHESSESPDSVGGASVSPQKVPQLGKDVVPQLQTREDEVASSFSVGSPNGRPPSVTSSRGGQARHKGRVNFNLTGGSRRRQVPKRPAVAIKQSTTKDVEAEARQAEDTVSHSQEERTKSKGKERAVGERSEPPQSRPSTSAEQPVSPVKTQQKQHRAPVSQQQSQNLRQLPTNPPRQQAQPPVRHPAPDEAPRSNAGQQQPNSRQLPFHPQLGHLGLAHLPTVPPRQRRPIEITETSSEYETTDTDESSWESESASGDDAGEGEERSRATRASGERQSRTSGGGTASRTRDAGEFQRDAEREAQRARELFQKLPARSYSHLGQLPRVKSGLSQLFQPDPQLFPEGHPYRTSQSSRDLLARNWSAPGPPLAMRAMAQRSAAAGVVQAAVTAEPVVTSVHSRQGEGSSGAQRPNGLQRGGYQRRGPPQDQEQETDSGDDDPEDTIQVSSSVAARRLAAIMGQRPARQPPKPSRANSHPEGQVQAQGPQPVARTTTAPLLMHPYLPDPAPLQTPHTVRRNIISQELDEELRRNLLWERSQNQIQGRPPRAAGSILPGPWRPLTSLRPEESREVRSNASDRGPGERPFATQRTKSWAGDFHAAGW